MPAWSFRAIMGSESAPQPGLEIGTRAARWVYAALGLHVATLTLATYCGAALTWDGAGLLFAVLDVQDLSLPNERFSVALFQLPVLAASKLTARVRVLEIVYGLVYAAVPFVAAYSSWRIVKETQPRLFLWPFLWVTVGALPGQLFMVTESVIALHVAWPLVLMLATGLSRWRALWSAVIVAFLFALHPVAAPILLFSAIFAVACAITQRPRTRELAISAALLATVGAARVVSITHNTQEMAQAGFQFAPIFRSLRLPAAGVLCACVVPVGVAGLDVLRGKWSRVLLPVVLLALTGTALWFFGWASDPRAWQDGLNFRYVAPFAAAPFLGGAALSAISGASRTRRLTERDAIIALGGALTFALVIGAQSIVWLKLRELLESALRQPRPCVALHSLRFARGTALKWWSTPSYALLIQGRQPRRLILNGQDCKRLDFASVVLVNPWYPRPRDRGWFDLRRVGLTEDGASRLSHP